MDSEGYNRKTSTNSIQKSMDESLKTKLNVDSQNSTLEWKLEQMAAELKKQKIEYSRRFEQLDTKIMWTKNNAGEKLVEDLQQKLINKNRELESIQFDKEVLGNSLELAVAKAETERVEIEVLIKKVGLLEEKVEDQNQKLKVEAGKTMEQAKNMERIIDKHGQEVEGLQQNGLNKDEEIRALKQASLDLTQEIKVLKQAGLGKDKEIRALKQVSLDKTQEVKILQQTILEKNENIKTLEQLKDQALKEKYHVEKVFILHLKIIRMLLMCWL